MKAHKMKNYITKIIAVVLIQTFLLTGVCYAAPIDTLSPNLHINIKGFRNAFNAAVQSGLSLSGASEILISQTEIVLARQKFIEAAQKYVDLLSLDGEFITEVDAFLVLGNLDIISVIRFAKRWKMLEKSYGKEVPIVITGGRGKVTISLVENVIEYYTMMGNITNVEKKYLKGENIYETDCLEFVFRKENIPLEFVEKEDKPSQTTAQNFANSLNPLKKIIGYKSNPVIVIITSPPLLLRAKATALKAWKDYGWQVKTLQTYRLNLEELSDDRLIEAFGFLCGYPQKYRDIYPNLNPYNELRRSQAENNPHVETIPLTAGDWQILEDTQITFEGFLDAIQVSYDKERNRLVRVRPEESLKFPFSGHKVDQEILKGKHVLFVSFRLDSSTYLGGDSPLDGVSLETGMWADLFYQMGANIYYFSGQTRTPIVAVGEKELEIAHFNIEPLQSILNSRIFKRGVINEAELKLIKAVKKQIKKELKQYLEDNEIDIVVSENVHAFPGNPALSQALAEILDELGNVRLIKHSHDFYWERDRFIVAPGKNLDEMLQGMVTANTENSATVVINPLQQKYLKDNFGIDSTVAPNVRDFDNPPEVSERQLQKFRNYFGIDPDTDILIGLPVRPIERKNLEMAFDLIKKLTSKVEQVMPKRTIKVMLTHPDGDEDNEYWKQLKEKTRAQGIHIIDAGDPEEAGLGAKEFDLETAYMTFDMVLFMSRWEGWGNALAEAMYYKKPIVVYPYLVYEEYIKPLGVQCIEAEEASDKVVDEIVRVLNTPEELEKMVEHNYEVGRKHLSLTALNRILVPVIKDLFARDKNGLNIKSLAEGKLIEQAI